MLVFLSVILCKFQEFNLHGFREIEFFLGVCFLCSTLYISDECRVHSDCNEKQLKTALSVRHHMDESGASGNYYNILLKQCLQLHTVY